MQKFTKFINGSELDVYLPETKLGFWKQLTVREGTRTNEIMVVVGVNTNGVNDEKLQQVKTNITQFFVNGDGKVCNVTSLYLQTADFL